MKKHTFDKAMKVLEEIIIEKSKDIPFMTSLNAPSKYKDLVEYYEKNGHFLIYNGDTDNTIYSNPRINVMFRAIHDKAHYDNKLTFKFQDERKLSLIQAREFYKEAEKKKQNLNICLAIFDIVMVEIAGQVNYYEKHRQFVSNQRDFTYAMLNLTDQKKGDKMKLTDFQKLSRNDTKWLLWHNGVTLKPKKTALETLADFITKRMIK